MASYNFSQAGDFTTSPVILSELQANIVASSISSATVLYLSQTGDTITIYFNGALSGPDQTTLSGLCAAYTNYQRPTATSTTTGDFNVVGGMGVGQNLWLGSAFTAANSTVAGSVFNVPSFTYTSSSSSPSNVNIATLNQVTIAETNASTTITNAASFYLAGAPLAGTNVTAITNPYTMYVAAGKTYLGGALQLPTGATNGYVLTSDSSGNATWAASSFSGGFGDGTSALPGIFFSAQPGTGFYRPASGQIGVELAGANYATFTTSGLNLVTGSTLNVGSSGTTSPLNVYGLITGSNGLTISAGAINLQTTTMATSSTAAALIDAGGLAVAKNMWLGTSFSGAVLTSNSVNGILFNAPTITMTDNTLAAGTTSNINIHSFGQVTLATSTNAVLATTAATLYIANAPAAGSNVTITTPYALQVAAGNTLLGGNLTVSGNFTVNGTTTTLNVTNVNSTDPLIELGANNVADTFDIGFFGRYVSSGTKFAGMIRQANTNNFYIFSAYTTDLTSATSVSSVSSFVANLFLNTMTASATTNQIVLGTTNTITVTAPAPASSRTYTIPDAGGAANFIMSTFGSTQTIAGGLTSSGLLTASSGFTLTTGALNLTSTSGAISLTGTSFITNSAISITATTLATSSTTGGLILSGGAGIAKNIWAGTSYSDAILTSNNTKGLVFNSPAVTLTDNALAAGTTSNINSVAFGQITLATSANAITATNAATLYIANAPAAGTNITITNPYALQVAAGRTYIGGSLQIPTGASNGFILTSDASGVATWAANSFTGGFDDGTAALPGIFFDAQPGTGFYRPASGQIGVELAGANYATFTTTGLNLVTGSTLNVGSSGTTSPLNVYGLITGSNGLTISAGATTLQTTTLATSSTAAAVVMSGGLAVAKNMWIGTSFSDAILTSNSTKGILFNAPAITMTDNALAAGTTSNINIHTFDRVTLATSTNAITATNATTLYIANAPLAGTNITITNPYALQVAAGKTLIGGALQITTGAAANQVLKSDSTGNASWGDPVLYYNAVSTAALTTTSTSLIAMSGITVTLVSIGTYQITLTGEFYNQTLSVRCLFDLYNATAAAIISNSSYAIAGTFFQNANNYGTATLNISVIVTISTPNTVIQGRFATSNASGSVTMVSSAVPGAGCNCTTSLTAVRLGA
jgi:hypothetical protein